MSALFETPDIPPMPEPPPPPAIEDAAAADQANADKRRKRKGRAATILNEPTGINDPATSAPTLLGS